MPKLVFEVVLPKQLNVYIEAVRVRVAGPKLASALTAYGAAVVKRMQTYPPARASSHYRRTGNLGRNWMATPPYMQSGNLVIDIGNNVDYASHVEGYLTQDPKQVDQFAKWGWPSLETVGNQYYATFRQAVINALQGRG